MKRGWITFALFTGATGAVVGPLGCGSSTSAPPVKPVGTAQSLRDPQTCNGCHPSHYGEWAGSMHAYASDDPVFLAMNARGQRETGGMLGDFCVKCHAPMAVRDGLTKDGLNLASLDASEKGVTCFFCHSVSSVGASHVNADLTLAGDLVMRGEFKDPQPNTQHASMYSTLQDDAQLDTAAMCGTCHDILTPKILTNPGGGRIERTFEEWGVSVFNTSATCAVNGNCHMKSNTTLVPIAKGGKPRLFRAHDFPAVDITFDPAPAHSGFATRAEQQATVESSLADALQGALCVNSRGGVRVFLDGSGPGHNFPSGAAQDRRTWVEVVAEKDGAPIYSSGSVPAGTPVGSDPTDKDLWVLRDQMFDPNDAKVDMFWQASCAAGNELHQLSAPLPDMPPPSTHQVRLYPNTRNPGDSVLPMPDKVTLTVHMQPIGLDVLNDLVMSKDLDPAIAAQAVTLTVGFPSPTDHNAKTLIWTAAAAAANGGLPDPTQGFGAGGVQMSCVSTQQFNVTGGTIPARDPPTTCGGAAPDAGAVSTPPVDAGPSADGGPSQDADAGAD
jgi:hypothetical protein